MDKKFMLQYRVTVNGVELPVVSMGSEGPKGHRMPVYTYLVPALAVCQAAGYRYPQSAIRDVMRRHRGSMVAHVYRDRELDQFTEGQTPWFSFQGVSVFRTFAGSSLQENLTRILIAITRNFSVGNIDDSSPALDRADDAIKEVKPDAGTQEEIDALKRSIQTLEARVKKLEDHEAWEDAILQQFVSLIAVRQ